MVISFLDPLVQGLVGLLVRLEQAVAVALDGGEGSCGVESGQRLAMAVELGAAAVVNLAVSNGLSLAGIGDNNFILSSC